MKGADLGSEVGVRKNDSLLEERTLICFKIAYIE